MHARSVASAASDRLKREQDMGTEAHRLELCLRTCTVFAVSFRTRKQPSEHWPAQWVALNRYSWPRYPALKNVKRK